MFPTPSPSLADYTPAQRVALALHGSPAFYMGGEDALQLSGWNITANARLRASVRFLGLDGRVQSSEHDLPLTTDRALANLTRQLGEGWLLNVTVRMVGATASYGATFGRVQIVRGVDASGIVLATLCAGYCNGAQPIAFPNGRILPMVEGPSILRSITGTNPAANTEISETVPTGARWRLLSLAAELVTDANAANRIPILLIDDGANIYFASDPAAVQAASTTRSYVGNTGGERLAAVGSLAQWTIPVEMILLVGHRISTLTTNRQVGDNWGPPQILVQEWLDGV